MVYLRSFEILEKKDTYPLCLPVLQERICFSAPVTILCGTNGCGKTTLLEIIAEISEAVRIGDEHIWKKFSEDDVLGQVRLTFSQKPLYRSYFSAENFSQYIMWLEQARDEANAAIADIDRACADGEVSEAVAFEMKKVHYYTLSSINEQYGSQLSQKSHGEGYMAFFKKRLHGNSLYLIDEPEGALTYENQFYLATMIMRAASEGSQFIIATHSPVLASIPNADVLMYEDNTLKKARYEDIADMQFLEMFMRRRKELFRQVLGEK